MNNNRDLFTGNLTAEPELNCPPKGTAVVNASLANNELYTSKDRESHKGHSASGRRFSTTYRSVQCCRPQSERRLILCAPKQPHCSCGWQKFRRVAPFFLKKTTQFKPADSGRRLTENGLWSSGL